MGATAVFGRRYVIHEKIGSGGMGDVYSATDRLLQRYVALKRLPAREGGAASPNDAFRHELRLALAREFRILASLRHPNIISVLDYGFDLEGQPFFTMRLLDVRIDVLEEGRKRDMKGKVELLIMILRALSYLHRCGILHRDLKPGNVLVERGEAKLLDFGLSVSRSEARGMAGSLPYLAPEVLRGEDWTPAADLYAVGVLAYQLFTGRHPFDTSDTKRLVDSVLKRSVNLSPFTHPLGAEADFESLSPDMAETLPAIGSDLADSVDAGPAVGEGGSAAQRQVGQPVGESAKMLAISEIVSRLLSKQPGERHGDAADVIRAFAAASGEDVPLETPKTRESFLQAAEFVGREGEMALLNQALGEAMDGKGRTILLGGESGVGKSRLIDEFRCEALVRGCIVLHGDGVSGGGLPYQYWRQPLRQLCCLAELGLQEASVLKPLVSDISALLEIEIPNPSRLDVGAAQERLVSTIEEVFRRQKRPILLILEDLQWIGESLPVLQRLVRLAPAVPLLIVGTFRKDERSDLPDHVPEAELLELQRFEKESVACLSRSMLGSGAPELVEFLCAQTEGNAFFLVEVVRALAEEAGRLDRISAAVLPRNVSSGGIESVVERRLSRVPEDALPRLQFAAVLGRTLERKEIEALEREGADLEKWLQECASATVLEVYDNRWRFSHDKLREGLLAALTPDRSARLHLRAAQSLELAYPDQPEQSLRLVYHWAEAGNRDKEAACAVRAAEHVFESGAYKEASGFATRALELRGQGHAPELDEAKLEHLLGEALFGLGDINGSRIHLERAAALLSGPVPAALRSQVWILATQLLRQAAHRVSPRRFLGRGRSGAPQDRLRRLSRIYERLGHVHYHRGDPIRMFCASFCNVNSAELAGPSPELARAYATQMVGFGLIPWHAAAETFSRLAKEALVSVEEPSVRAWSNLLASVYMLGIGRWKECEKSLTDSLKIYTEIGDRRRWEETAIIFAYAFYFQGKLNRCGDLLVELEETARSTQDKQAQCWALAGQSEIARMRADYEGCLALLQDAFELSRDRGWIEETWVAGLLAWAHSLNDDPESAREMAGHAHKLLSHSAPTAAYTFGGYVGACQSYLQMQEWNAEPSKRDHLAQEASRCLKALEKFSRVFPIAQSAKHRLFGWREFLAGKPAKAKRLWQKSRSAAARLGMPIEEAFALYELARRLEGNEGEGAMISSRQIFQGLDVLSALNKSMRSGKPI